MKKHQRKLYSTMAGIPFLQKVKRIAHKFDKHNRALVAVGEPEVRLTPELIKKWYDLPDNLIAKVMDLYEAEN